MKTVSVCAALFLLAGSCAAAAEPDPGILAVAEIDGIAADPSVFDAAGRGKPLEIKTSEEATKYFKEEALEKLTGKVDFGKQFVLVFAWKGSGQDELVSTVAESDPEKAFFELQPGRTRDDRGRVDRGGFHDASRPAVFRGRGPATSPAGRLSGSHRLCWI